MIWIAVAASWISTAAAVIYAISATGKASALWAMLIPALISYSSRRSKNESENNAGKGEANE